MKILVPIEIPEFVKAPMSKELRKRWADRFIEINVRSLKKEIYDALDLEIDPRC